MGARTGRAQCSLKRPSKSEAASAWLAAWVMATGLGSAATRSRWGLGGWSKRRATRVGKQFERGLHVTASASSKKRSSTSILDGSASEPKSAEGEGRRVGSTVTHLRMIDGAASPTRSAKPSGRSEPALLRRARIEVIRSMPVPKCVSISNKTTPQAYTSTLLEYRKFSCSGARYRVVPHPPVKSSLPPLPWTRVVSSKGRPSGEERPSLADKLLPLSTSWVVASPKSPIFTSPRESRKMLAGFRSR
mmetsp:Transcript_33741/g.76306  ORF Transcript_33741/g.76306 Transcript_33741/m.76306 type:complete len:247 (+) Transcript_33741:2202-2942(+)